MRVRSIFYYYYAVEQKESWSIRSAASHIWQGVNDQKPAPKHPRSGFFIWRSLFFFINRRSTRPALR